MYTCPASKPLVRTVEQVELFVPWLRSYLINNMS